MQFKRRKKWATKFNSTELKGSTALILGPGAIGSEIGRLLQAFGVKTIGCNRTGRSVNSMDEVITFDELLSNLPEADFVISVLPSTPGNERTFNCRTPGSNEGHCRVYEFRTR